ncbi:hypothetical protein [Vibrio crassostreae]|uniref:hypothetical protein n=1 Tax=Vibrio crassostreae TaxID=246167 RepID=UPI001B30ED95|nr:hypothetical protein [Vibrio crassostreae]
MAKALPIKPENIDYDMLKIELDKLNSQTSFQLDGYAVDVMLSTNFIKEDYARYVSALNKTSQEAVFDETRVILAELNIEKLKEGGVLSYIPVVGTIFSYDIKCFIARLNIYAEDLRDDRTAGLHKISLLKKAVIEADSILRKIEESSQDTATLMAAMEQYLFTCYSERVQGVNLVDWVSDHKTSVVLLKYGDLADTIKEVSELERSLKVIKAWLASAITLLQRSNSEIFGEGIVEVINRLNNLSKHNYKIEKEAEHWLAEKDGVLVLGVTQLKEKVNEIMELVIKTQAEVGDLHNDLLDTFVDLSKVKLNKIDIKLVEKPSEE